MRKSQLFRSVFLLWLLAPLMLCSKAACSQEVPAHHSDTLVPVARQPLSSVDPTIKYLDFLTDTLFWIQQGHCKSYNVYAYTGFAPARGIRDVGHHRSKPEGAALPRRNPLLTVHGNIRYDFLYRSYIDTPFSQKDFQQHTLQTTLHITVRDRYPFLVQFSNRQSNSAFFRDFTDVQLQLDQGALLKMAKRKLADKLQAQYQSAPALHALQAALAAVVQQYLALQEKLSSPGVLQQLIEERENAYYAQRAGVNKLPELPSFTGERKFKFPSKGSTPLNPTDDSVYTRSYVQGREKLDSLQGAIHRLQAKADSLKQQLSGQFSAARNKVNGAANLRQLHKLRRENDWENEEASGEKEFLSHIRTLGIGRSLVHYSELTVWNLSLTGLNLEYNARMYAAVAAGKIDFGFRDFAGRSTRQSGQHLVMGRIGIGDKERRAVIFSAFSGKKYTYGATRLDSVQQAVGITGYSVEAIWKKDAYNGLSAELAKTTPPRSRALSGGQELKSLWTFSSNANLGLSLKGQALWRATRTQLSGFYRKTGEQFQSFSWYAYRTDQTAWQLRAEQPLLQDRITVVAMMRQNDFTNPFTEKTFKSSTLFGSLQTTVRFAKWPQLSAGYYPGSQLFFIDRERVGENAYYILNASVVHSYTAAGTRLLSSLVYNRYTSKGTDSGFIAYEGASYMASQSLLWPKLQVQAQYVYTDQEQLQYRTLEGGGEVVLTPFVRAGAGGKYNQVRGGNSYWGGRAQVSLEFKRLGGLQLQYDKSFLPTLQHTLFPVEVGRVSWFKFF